jgi:serine phosphatase RsbU (regulator of sigma subunit)/Tfp pilus assembly protein PilF
VALWAFLAADVAGNVSDSVGWWLNHSLLMPDSLPAEAFASAEKALKLADNRHSDKSVMLGIYEQLAVTAREIGNDDLALSYFYEALHYASAADEGRKAVLYNHIGDIAFQQGKYDVAMEYFPKALQIREKMNDTDGMASSCLNIGSVLQRDGKYQLAEEKYKESLAWYEKTGNQCGQVDCYNNLGGLAMEQWHSAEALNYYHRSEELCRLMQQPELLAEICNNIGTAYHHINESANAEQYYRKALSILHPLPNARNAIAETYCSIGQFFDETNHKDSAIMYYSKAIDTGTAVYLPDILQRALKKRSKLFVEKQQYDRAYEDYVRYKAASDLLNDPERARHFTEQYMQYLFNKVQQEQLSRNRIQRIFNIALSVIVLLIGLLAIVLFRSYRQKNRANLLLADRQREITDSINYAGMIQKATLTAPDYMNRTLNNQYFILYKPLYIVSGDFYWVMQKGRYIVAVAADCTGHGVPGAFVSMLGISSLNKIVCSNDILDAADILNRLRMDIVHLLNPEGKATDTNDGMDVALVIIDTEAREIEFAGANNPLYMVSCRQLTEMKPARMPVGLHLHIDQPFTAVRTSYLPGDMIYLFSDGYADQFGGVADAKYKSKKFKEFLTDIGDKPVARQVALLEQEHLVWKGNREQTDDILVLGIKLQ